MPIDQSVVKLSSWPNAIAGAIPSSSSDWPTATDEPIPVTAASAAACGPNVTEFEHGPHFVPAIVVRTNPEAISAFRSKQTPMPVGTIIIKEKHSTISADSAPDAFGAMIKREPGYDSENGDWEYVFGKTSPMAIIERGRLANCIACHSEYASESDYLFRTYVWDTE